MRSQQMLRRNHPKKTAAILLILSCIIAVLPTLPLYAQKADTDEITIVREETDRRTASEKHYLCSDGSVMAVSFSGDVHYMDENGKYQDIDNTLSYNAAKGQYRSTGNPGFKVSFGASANQPGAVLEDGKGNTLFSQTTVSHSPMSAVAMRALMLQPAALSLHNETKAEVKGMSKDADEVLAVPGLHAQLNYENAFGSGISAQYALDGYDISKDY